MGAAVSAVKKMVEDADDAKGKENEVKRGIGEHETHGD